MRFPRIHRLGTVGLAVWLAGCADTSSGDSLEEQQEAQGWGAENCPATPQGVSVGFKLGDQLGELVLFDCAGEPVNLNALCGAEAAWLSFAHMWCPHCAKAASEMEAIHQSYVDAGHDLASVSIVVEDVSIERPDETDCSNWRDEHAQDRVVTLYDDDTDSFVLWEENLTNLNVLLTKERVIQSKIHSDREADIRAVIDRALE